MAASLRARLVLVVAAVALSMMACKADTDLGKPGCHLLKALPDGGPTNVIVAELSAGKDFLSFGSVECEDLICVLDQDGVSTLLAQATANPAVLADPATGYCSHACAQGSTGGCTPQYQDYQNDPTQVMSCRALVLDNDTIAEICKDPVKCQQYFNNSRSAFFCARGGDGGT
ncbi:MAG TPA: adventurous gliding motility lipoprotein CglC [Myxococcaceae bacterium]|nr:adventurous gliding motility lipoprotein CglC [Myxococcaceae bacterium]